MVQQFPLHVRVLPSIIYDFLIFRNVTTGLVEKTSNYDKPDEMGNTSGQGTNRGKKAEATKRRGCRRRNTEENVKD